ncbi:MAG TPA: acyl-ACP--UDP-N-acetylglucosamine O-acyltransferase [Anaeromyxobacteraceae bacterium]|nr:acyl-ACP--UDP-N-acetylglucosamine O-acyltransferase [Anaeromyxobacteraceae bacterium]
MAIHPTAVISPGAEIDSSCEIGPYAVIGPRVRMGPGNTVGPHAIVEGNTVLGASNRIFGHAVVGAPPQDLKYRGEDTRLELGDGNVVREFASVHTGTVGGGGVTRLGDQCLVMASAHVAHDCILGNRVIVATFCALAGHVVAEDGVIFGGVSAVQQFSRIGRLAYVGGITGVNMDVAPYLMVSGARGEVVGINQVGLQRAGFTEEQIARVKTAYKIVFRSKLPLKEALDQVKAELGGNPEIDHWVRFIEASERGILR